LRLQASPHEPRPPPRTEGKAPPRVGLALAGGGPLGAIYEIGALCALEEASCRRAGPERLDGYVGVSAGGFVAAAWPTA
jgi:NTE family protein